jgi:hypothetical protein
MNNYKRKLSMFFYRCYSNLNVNFTRYIYIVLITEYNIRKVVKKMKIASEISTRQELDDLKTIMEIYVVKHRISELAKLA